MPLLNASIQLPTSYVFVVRTTDIGSAEPDLSGSPIVALGERHPEYASFLEDYATFVAVGDWELAAIDASPEAMAAGPPIVQVYVWKFYNGESAAELADVLIEDRKEHSQVEDVSRRTVTLPAAKAVRTRYIYPAGFMTDEPWVWFEYTMVIGDRAFGLAMQAPADQEQAIKAVFAEIASSFALNP